MAGKYITPIEPNLDIHDPRPTAVQAAWSAGVYEGEGHASGVMGRTIANVTQKDPEILYRLRELFGGRIEMLRSGTPHYCHQWKLYGDKARRFFQIIYPHLSNRRRLQIEKCNGLRLNGFVMSHEPMSEERKALRSTMTSKEKDQESWRHYREKNITRVRKEQREYLMAKRHGKLPPQSDLATQVLQ